MRIDLKQSMLLNKKEQIVLEITLDEYSAQILARICTRHRTVQEAIEAKDQYGDNHINQLLLTLWLQGLIRDLAENEESN